jgi:hypothetical protein
VKMSLAKIFAVKWECFGERYLHVSTQVQQCGAK